MNTVGMKNLIKIAMVLSLFGMVETGWSAERRRPDKHAGAKVRSKGPGPAKDTEATAAQHAFKKVKKEGKAPAVLIPGKENFKAFHPVSPMTLVEMEQLLGYCREYANSPLGKPSLGNGVFKKAEKIVKANIEEKRSKGSTTTTYNSNDIEAIFLPLIGYEDGFKAWNEDNILKYKPMEELQAEERKRKEEVERKQKAKREQEEREQQEKEELSKLALAAKALELAAQKKELERIQREQDEEAERVRQEKDAALALAKQKKQFELDLLQQQQAIQAKAAEVTQSLEVQRVVDAQKAEQDKARLAQEQELALAKAQGEQALAAQLASTAKTLKDEEAAAESARAAKAAEAQLKLNAKIAEEKSKSEEKENQENIRREEERERRSAKAKADKVALIEASRGKTRNAFLNDMVRGPAVIVGAAFITTVGAYYLIKLGMPALFMAKPPGIINETSIKLGFAALVQKVRKKAPPPESRRGDMVYPPELATRLDQIIASTKQAIERHRPLMNMLFYGPPGTGKTLFAKEVARQSSADYIITSGSNLMQLSVKDALFQLKEMLNLAEKNPIPVILFFDEADSVFMHRKNASEDALKLTNMFLTLVDKPSNPKLMIIFATNRPGELDDAIMSRISKHSTLFFTPPGAPEREKMLKVYLNKNVTSKGYKIYPGVMDKLPKVAKSIEGWAGREIEQLTLDIAVQMELTNQEILDEKLMDKIVAEIFKNSDNLKKFDK